MTDLDGKKRIFLASSKKEQRDWVRAITAAIAESDGSFAALRGANGPPQQHDSYTSAHASAFEPLGSSSSSSSVKWNRVDDASPYAQHMRTFILTREGINKASSRNEYLRATHGMAAHTSLHVPVPWVRHEMTTEVLDESVAGGGAYGYGSYGGGYGGGGDATEVAVRSDLAQLWKDMGRDRVTVVGESSVYDATTTMTTAASRTPPSSRVIPAAAAAAVAQRQQQQQQNALFNQGGGGRRRCCERKPAHSAVGGQSTRRRWRGS